MNPDMIRVGLIGAGGNVKARHIPGFRGIDGVELVAVANRSEASGRKIADEFGIARVYADWRELIADDDVDAVCIGTWPYMHCPVTLAALEAGKHVLCEARMSMDAAQSHQMLAASRRHSNLVAQLVPSPFTLGIDGTIKAEIASGRLGNVLVVEMRFRVPGFLNNTKPMTWRQDEELSGLNAMGMGIGYEAMMRWTGHATRVMANARTFCRPRPDEPGARHGPGVPNHIDIIADLPSGAVANIQVSSVTGCSPYEEEGWIFGSEGTLKLDFDSSRVFAAYRDSGTMRLISPSLDEQVGWRVEEEFINAIRGNETVSHTTFEDGVKYMEFTEAVMRSARSGAAVSLPLEDIPQNR